MIVGIDKRLKRNDYGEIVTGGFNNCSHCDNACISAGALRLSLRVVVSTNPTHFRRNG
jgi:hypothetical protein